MIRGVLEVCSKRLRKNLYILGVLLLFGTAMELMILSTIPIAVTILLTDDIDLSNSIVLFIYEILGTSEAVDFKIRLMLAGIVFFLFKNVYMAFVQFYQYKILAREQSIMCSNLLTSYVNRDYEFHLNNNSSILIQNVVNEVYYFFSMAVIPGLMLFAEGVVFIAIGILVIIYQPVISIIGIFSILICMSSFYFVFKKFVERWGQEQHTAQSSMIKTATQLLSGIKEVKVSGVEKNGLNKFSVSSEKFSSSTANFLLLNQMPRFFVETLIILIVLFFLLLNTASGDSLVDALPLIFMYGAVAVRLLPSMNRIIYSFNQFKFGKRSLDLIKNDLLADTKGEPETQSPIILKGKISVRDLYFHYEGTSENVLNGVSFEVKRGEVIGVMGESGAGKSTLIDVLTGLLKPQKGNVFSDQKSVFSNIRSWQKNIGFIPQKIFLNDDTLARNIAFGISGEDINYQRIREVVDQAQMSEFVSTLPDGLETMVGEDGVRISGGQAQRIGIARALYHDPELIIMDEATSALDNNTEAGFMDTLMKFKETKTIIIIAHRLTTLTDCDKVILLESGKVADQGEYSVVLNRNGLA